MLALVILLIVSVCAAQLSTNLQLTDAPINLEWKGVASASLGSLSAAVAYNSGIYLSTNGYDWSNSTAPPLAWRAITVSATGERLCAVVYGGGIYTSSTYGNSWVVTDAPNENWISVTSSESGQYLFAAVYYGDVYGSLNYGSTWTKYINNAQPWTSISCSSTGFYVVIVGTSCYASISNPDGEYTVSISTTSQMNATSVTSDASGGLMYATVCNGQIYVSTSFGTLWKLLSGSPQKPWVGITTSSSGASVYAVSNSSLYYSVNQGSSWMLSSTTPQPWTYISTCNYSGALFAATSGSGLYSNLYTPTSTPSGTPSSYPSTQPSSSPSVYFEYSYTLVELNSISLRYSAIVSSNSGQYLYGAASTAGIYASTDYGNNWDVVLNNEFNWWDIACSSSGQFVYAVIYGGAVYNSSSYGAIWDALDVSIDFFAVATNANGQYVYAGADGSIAYSMDFGETWNSTKVITSAVWNGIACSNSGQYVTAVNNNEVLVSTNYGLSFSYGVDGVDIADVAMSDSGQFQSIVYYGDAGGVFVSSTYGENWHKASAPYGTWNSIACDSTGQYLFITDSVDGVGGGVYASPNQGVSWSQTASPKETWSAITVSANAQYLAAVVDNGGLYTNHYNVPTSRPSSSPSSAPSLSPSLLPTSQPTGQPSQQPHTSFPSSLPSSQPSSQPTLQPSSYPTYIPDTVELTSVVYTQTPTSSYVFNNLGCGTPAYLSARIIVSYLDVSSQGYLRITAGSGDSLIVVSDVCAPQEACGGVVCSVNVNITSAMTCEGGGSVALYATTMNTSQDSGVDIRCTYDDIPGLQYALSYTVSVNPLPTAMPTAAPSLVGKANFVFQASPNTPFYIIVMCTLLMAAMGVFVVRVKDKSGLYSNMKLSSTCVDMALIGYHLASELFYIVVLYDQHLATQASLVIAIRILSALIGGYFLLTSLGFFVHSEDYVKMLNKKMIFKNASIFSVVIVVMFLEQSMVRYLPWNESVYTSQSRGFPSQHLFKVCVASKVCQLLASLIIQLVVILASDAALFESGHKSGQLQIALALVVLYLISSISTIVLFVLTSCVRLRMGQELESTTSEKGASSVNPVHDDHDKQMELVEMNKSSAGSSSLEEFLKRIVALEVRDKEREQSLKQQLNDFQERECLLNKRIEDLESRVERGSADVN